jgi:alpha-glucosidase (family GH31 glycosyl hydrolase)
MSMHRGWLLCATVLAVLLAGSGSARAATAADAGALRAVVSNEPWSLTLTGEQGTVLAEHRATGPLAGSMGTLGFRAAGIWQHATRVLSASSKGGEYVAELATTDPARRIDVRLSAPAEGVIALDAAVRGPGPPATALGVGFQPRAGEAYLGFGERSNAVDQRGNVVENYVADGPYQSDEYPVIEFFVPRWGLRPRDDSTYYPVPWLLSSAGYGVLVDSPETSYFRLNSAGGWSVELVNAPPDELPPPTAPPPDRLSLRFFAGPKPADALQRFTRETGRQPPPAAPWVFGPWLQPPGGTESQLELLDQQRAADVPLSVAQTYLHYLPCGDHVGRRDEERARTAGIHERGLAVTTYFNPMVCSSYSPVYDETAANGGLISNALGSPYLFRYSTDTSFEVAEFDFTAPAGREGFSSVTAQAIADGHDGWMEDFGEYTPLDSQTAAGVPGTVVHNEYPRQYHCAAFESIADAGRPIVRFQRSGWTGAAPCAQVVWGGDPTTSWGFDGLQSSVRQALTMGLSGISTWGSDIGGFFALFDEQLEPELLTRWVQFGAVSGVMRTQANGIAVPPKSRPQVWDPDQLGNWRRYTKLRTQLYPYLVAADAQYRRSGLPLMRHLSLAYPSDPRAVARDDEFLFGPDLLAAPVLEPGLRERALYLPPGRWVHLWDALDYAENSGGLTMGDAELLTGAAEVTVPAPLDQLPLFARAGTILPLLPPEVDTLADDYDTEATTSFAERSDRLVLLAFPHGRSDAVFYEDERLRSHVHKDRWTLKVQGSAERAYELHASMATIGEDFVPCALRVNGKPMPPGSWRYEPVTEVLTTTLSGRSPHLTVSARCKRDR